MALSGWQCPHCDGNIEDNEATCEHCGKCCDMATRRKKTNDHIRELASKLTLVEAFKMGVGRQWETFTFWLKLHRDRMTTSIKFRLVRRRMF